MLEEQQASFPNFTFFPIPNPNPLLSYSFDVPQPIIHPPGTDPYSLSNPTQHGNVRLEPLPALDVDPSAASWSEIITKTTDLTASEHAGQTLSETTRVSTTSHSLGNSGVVTQHLVNDVIATTIQSENTRSIQCDICNITCNSEDVLKSHKGGKKHLKNLQKLALSSAITQEAPPPVANTTLDGELEKKKHNLLQKGASVNSLPFCDISDVGNNQDISTEHLVGKKHAAQAGRTLSETTTVSTTSHSPGNSGVVTLRLVNDVIGTTIQSENTRSIQCDVCNITCNGEDVLKSHKEGKKHLKNLQKLALSSAITQEAPPLVANATLDGELEKKKHNLLQKEASVNSLPFCDISDVGNIQDISTEHLVGKKHTAQAGRTLSETTRVSRTSHSLGNSGVVTQHLVNDVIVTTIQSENTRSIQCDVCNITCNGEDVLKSHKEGKKHLKNLQKLALSSAITQEAPPPVANATLDGELEKKKHNLLQKEALVNSLPFCDISDVGNDHDISTEHLVSKKHAAQAGRTLSETTRVSTTPHSPGNSGVVTQRLMNNVIATTIQSENTRSIQCDVCSIACNSEDVLKRHKHGKKHLKNLQKLALSSAITQETPRPAANATLDGELVKKKHNLLQKGASVNS